MDVEAAVAGNWHHLCVDMQRMFAEETPWHVDWMNSIADNVVELAGQHAARTTFTRFVPPRSSHYARGAWREYYQKWQELTLDRLPLDLVDLIGPLQRYVPPGLMFDKPVYSPWFDGRLHDRLQCAGIETLAVTGGETDVCVLATVLGAIDLGYRILLVGDAVCSGRDQTHDAALELLSARFSCQVAVVPTEDFLLLTH